MSGPPTSILVVGAGPVGHALAAGFSRAGLALHHWSRSRGTLRQEGQPRTPPDVVILAVRDDVIGQAARFAVAHGSAGPDTVLLHCAGAIPPLLAFAEQRGQVAGCGLLHPLRSLSGQAAAADLSGTVMAVCGDERGLSTATFLAQALAGHPLVLLPEQLGAYHGAAALCAGHVAALLDAAVGTLMAIGLPRHKAEQALAALCGSVADNVAAIGLPAALTGPVARGDADTVARHLAALPLAHPEADRLYRALLPAVLRLARDKGAAAKEDLDRIAQLAPP
jgi:predicted short-subunit dehydrogenase-like oxidoreductase (DUF2520 family)